MEQISINEPKTKRSGQAIHSVCVWMWSEPKTSVHFFDSTVDSNRKRGLLHVLQINYMRGALPPSLIGVCLVGVGHAQQCMSLHVKYEETLEVQHLGSMSRWVYCCVLLSIPPTGSLGYTQNSPSCLSCFSDAPLSLAASHTKLFLTPKLAYIQWRF